MNKFLCLLLCAGTFLALRLDAMQLAVPSGRSKVKLYYDERVLLWDVDEKAALKECKKLSNVVQDDHEIVLRHFFPLSVERLYLAYAVAIKKYNQYSGTETCYYWPGSITLKNKKLYGFFESTVVPYLDGVRLYHRCFTTPSAKVRIDYPDEVINADANASYNWHEYVYKCKGSDKDFMRKNHVMHENVNEKAIMSNMQVDKSYNINEIITNDDNFVIPSVEITDDENPDIIYRLHTAHIKKDGSADTTDYYNN